MVTRASTPNVLLVVVDCLRADRVAGSGGAHIPTIERLARGGTIFSQTFAAASSSTPSFATMLTGRPPFVHGVRRLTSRLGPALPTLPEVLGAHGYHTVARVTGAIVEDSGLSRGFRDFEYRPMGNDLQTKWGAPLTRALRTLPRPWFFLLHLFELHAPRRIPASFQRSRFGETVYDRALSALDSQLGPLIDAVPPDTIILLTGDHGERVDTAIDRPGLKQKVLGLLVNRHIPGMWRMARTLTPRIAHDRLRRVQRSLLYPVELHGRRVGFGLNDYLIGVPWVMCGPGVPQAGTIRRQVRHTDIFPTILDLLGLPPQPHLEPSLLPVMNGRPEDERPAYAEVTDPLYGWITCLRSGGFKYVLAPDDPTVPEMLFDLALNPAEQRNVVAREAARTEDMRRRLLAMLAGASPPPDEPSA